MSQWRVGQLTRALCLHHLPERSKLTRVALTADQALISALQGRAGKWAGIATLAAAHKLGMPYTGSVIAGTAQFNKLAEVQYLHRQGCPCLCSCLAELLAVGSLSCCAGATSTAVLLRTRYWHHIVQRRAATLS
jgi:hypothetical protein